MSDTDADLTALLADVRAKAEAWTNPPRCRCTAQGGGVYSSQCPLHDPHEPDYLPPFKMDPATTLRLVDAVEAEVADLRTRLADADAVRDQWKRTAAAHELRANAAEARLADAEATIQRVRDLPEKLRGVVGSPEPRAWSRWAAERIDAALDGPQDGGEGR